MLASAFAVVPARLGCRKPTRADGCCALLPAVLVWLWAACIWSKPGLTIGFDAFRCLGITAMVLWACGLAAGFRHASVRKWTAAALLLAASLGAEVFIGNLNFWATHSYEPVDLRAYLQEAEDDHNALTLDDEHTTLTFTGLDRELYNLQLSGLEYVYNGAPSGSAEPAVYPQRRRHGRSHISLPPELELGSCRQRPPQPGAQPGPFRQGVHPHADGLPL